jgi:hypothetical protein
VNAAAQPGDDIFVGEAVRDVKTGKKLRPFLNNGELPANY